MRRALLFLAAAVILLLAAKPGAAAPGRAGVGDRLSLSITNKYGDVLTNPAVAQILSDGLILEHGTMAMKVKYQDLPPAICKKYQPLAAGVIQREAKEDAVNAAYLAYTQKLQAEQSRHLAAQEQKENAQAGQRHQSPAADSPQYLTLSLPDLNWKLTLLNLGFRHWKTQGDSRRFALHCEPGPGGYHLAIFVEAPANRIPGNDPVYHYFWLNMANSSLIDAQSVRVEQTDKFIKVSYTAQRQPNVNYFFACEGKWVDAHLWKTSFEPGDEKTFADFGQALSYGE